MPVPSIGVCSWSLQAKSVPELVALMDQVGVAVVQVALGDPNHATWEEGADLVPALKRSNLDISGTMIGFPGEDYTSPETIKATGGFGNPETRDECLKIFKHAVDQTVELGLANIMSHAGFIPESGDPRRQAFLDCLGEAADHAEERGVIFAMETGQETAELLRRTLDELGMDSLRVNFDPANMLLYDMGDPIRAIEILGPDIESVHVKDARPPVEEGAWGEEVPLGEGDVDMKKFLAALVEADYVGPLVIEREVGDQEQRVRDIRAGVQLLQRLITRG